MAWVRPAGALRRPVGRFSVSSLPLTQSHDLRRLPAGYQLLDVASPKPKSGADFVFKRVDLIDADDATKHAAPVVESTLDRLGADAESLHPAGTSAARVMQAPARRIEAGLDADALLDLGPANDRGPPIGGEHKVAAVYLRQGSQDGPSLRRQRHSMLLCILGALRR